MKRKIGMLLLLLLCISCMVGCSQDPESITKEDLDEALRKYFMELEQDALEPFKVIGKDRTCQYFTENIKNCSSYENYNANLVSMEIDDYKFVYDKYYTEPNAELDKLVQLNAELDSYIQRQSDIYEKYPFSFYECASDIQNQSMYVTNRIESAYDDNLLGMIQQELDSYTEEGSYWCAYNVLYDSWLGNYPGDNAYILYSSELNPFNEAGVHDIWYYADGTTLATQDSRGFQSEVPVLYIVDESDYLDFSDAESEIFNVIVDIHSLYDGNTVSNTDTSKTKNTDITSNSITGTDYIGFWQDSYSERCSLNIEKTDDIHYSILITWPSSANENTEWIGDAVYDDSSNRLVYTCVCFNTVYKDDGSTEENLIYDGGEGILYIDTDGNLYWEDYLEDMGSNCVFVKCD